MSSTGHPRWWRFQLWLETKVGTHLCHSLIWTPNDSQSGSICWLFILMIDYTLVIPHVTVTTSQMVSLCSFVGREGTAIAVASLPKFLSRIVAGSVSGDHTVRPSSCDFRLRCCVHLILLGHLLAIYCPDTAESGRRSNILWLIIGYENWKRTRRKTGLGFKV